MKKIFTLLLFCFALSSNAQVVCNADTNYRDVALKILKNINKAQIPTGVLYDAVFPLAGLDLFTGGTTTDTSNATHFLQAYSELYLSRINNTGMQHLSDFEDNIDNYNPDKKFRHPIGIIDYEFNTIRPDAVTNNLFSVSNNQLFDVPGRTQSPYEYRKTAVASVLTTEEYPCFFPGTHFLEFTQSFVVSNTGFTLAQVSNLQVILNGVTVYNNPVSGLNNFTLPITISNNDQLGTIILQLTVNGILKTYIISTCQTSAENITNCRGTDQIPITGYLFDGGYAEGYYAEKGIATIYYSNQSCGDKRLRRPIIFVDGFDPTNSQDHQKIWKDYLNLAFDDGNNPNTRLGDELLAKGYDVIILDQKKANKKYNRGGAGLVENNGLVLAKLLETLYTQHSTSMIEDFVVVGASMGGLVARYGLSWMEANYIPHHTRLFISFDSPQDGAQLSIGLQQTVDKLTQTGVLAISAKVKNMLHQSNAAKQLLLHHSSSQSESVQQDPFRTRLYNNLALVGNYPTQCRMVAIVNGNRDGKLKTFIPAPNTYDAVPINQKDKIADFGVVPWVLPFCNSNICYLLNAQVYAQTSSNRSKANVYAIKYTTLLTMAFLSGGNLPFLPRTQYAVAQNGTSLDVAPGSRLRQNPLGQLEGFLLNSLVSSVGAKIKISTNSLKHSNFIPTFSSVGYTWPNGEVPNNYKDFTGIVLSKCAGTTVFDTAYAPNIDMPHVAINQYIAESFRTEIYNLKSKSVCSSPCPDYVNLNAITPSGIYGANKAICLLPNFKAENGSLITAQIGCGNATVILPQKATLKSIVTLSICPLDWDSPNNNVFCGNGFTTFTLFVKNLPLETYAEFSINNSTWFKANYGDKGYNLNLNSNPGQQQIFYARSHNDPTQIINIAINHCP
jgi:PGAP1-like protein